MIKKAVGFTSLLVFVALLFAIVAVGKQLGLLEPDAKVTHGDETVASTVCGIMYAIDDTATRADFQLLLQRTRETCEEPEGTETSYKNPDGSLKHTVIIGDEDTVRTKGSKYDCCIINWELDQVTAFKAFEEVCLNRQF